MGSLLDYNICFCDLFHLDPSFCVPDHDPDLVTYSGLGLHREEDGGDLIVTIGLIETPLMGKNRMKT